MSRAMDMVELDNSYDIDEPNEPGKQTAASADALRDIGLHEQIVGFSSPNRTYPIDKLEAHRLNVPHLAVSIFVFKGNQLLLQQRARTKYHSPGLWANTVCSHPRWQESDADCAQRRLQEELGWTTPLISGEKIDYRARVGDLYENEKVRCFIGSLENKSEVGTGIESLTKLFNPLEVSNLRWMSLNDIDTALESTPERFSAWFKIYMSVHRNKLHSMMETASRMQLPQSCT